MLPGFAIASSVFAISSLVVAVVAAQVIWGWIFARGIIAGQKASEAPAFILRAVHHSPVVSQVPDRGPHECPIP